MFCFDTDILVTVVRRDPPLGMIRRLAMSPPSCQFTTSISYGELFYSAARQESEDLAERGRGLLLYSTTVLPFDEDAALRYGRLTRCARLGRPTTAEPISGSPRSPSAVRSSSSRAIPPVRR